MEGFRKGVPFSMEAARADCSAWLREHGVESAERIASMETSRWVSLVLVARFSSPEVLGHHGELASVLAPEHRALDHDALLPLLFEMSFIRAACKQPAVIGRKPAEEPGSNAPGADIGAAEVGSEHALCCQTAAAEDPAAEDDTVLGRASAGSESAAADEEAAGAANLTTAAGAAQSLEGANIDAAAAAAQAEETGREPDGALAAWIARVVSNETGEEEDACVYCRLEEEAEGNELLFCGVCSCQFHQRCLPVRNEDEEIMWVRAECELTSAR